MRELEDFKWFPKALRRHQMDFLSLLALKFGLYLPLKPHLEALLEEKPASSGWTDACSGSGGPAISLAGNRRVLLTDLYPPFASLTLPPNIRYHPQPVDITMELPGEKGPITLFNSFHHFSTRQQSEIIGKCRDTGRPLLVAEVLQPGLRSLLSVLVATTIGHWLLVPFMKPFRIERLLLTYLIPLHTLTVLYDGIVSVFKSKNISYYRNLAQSTSNGQYKVAFEIVGGPFGPLYLIKGIPQS